MRRTWYSHAFLLFFPLLFFSPLHRMFGTPQAASSRLPYVSHCVNFFFVLVLLRRWCESSTSRELWVSLAVLLWRQSKEGVTHGLLFLVSPPACTSQYFSVPFLLIIFSFHFILFFSSYASVIFRNVQCIFQQFFPSLSSYYLLVSFFPLITLLCLEYQVFRHIERESRYLFLLPLSLITLPFLPHFLFRCHSFVIYFLTFLLFHFFIL